MLRMVPVGSLVAAEDNLRRRVGEVRELAASIASVGIVEPLLVAPAGEDGRFVVVAGHRRLVAARRAGLAEVPCTVRELSEAERVEIMLVENLQRSDLTPIEEASGYFRLVEHGMTHKQLAGRIGRSARHVAGRLALLELPKLAQDELHAGTLTVAEAQALLSLKRQPDVIERLLGDEWARRDLERAVVREQHRQDAAQANARRRHATTTQPVETDARTPGAGPDPSDTEDHCVEHSAHGSEPSTGKPSPPDREDRARNAAKARRAAATARVRFAQELIARKVPKADVSGLVAAQMLADLAPVHARTACQILGIEPVEGRWGADHRAALEAHAATSGAARERALFAAALAIGEEHARHGATDACAARHLDFLAAYGHEPTADSQVG